MSADCLFVVRNCWDSDQLQKELSAEVQRLGLGVWLAPNNALLSCGQIRVETDTFLFEPTDAPGSISTELLLYPDYYSVNGTYPALSLNKRAYIIQELAQICLNYADIVEIYMSEDNPYLPDFVSYDISQHQIRDTLILEYAKDDRRLDPIPCIYMRVTKQASVN